ncbi:hypothetical protein [Granulicella mallensis]|uniref:Uncharacterized protein n=1 Tax=Granulicella mallensis (strain ATCC BAA-1857 / DSM 23137 / MP5ACTX8) TaxID=682795 RepID=G8NZ56_GRAMM|nr:hypothetical protein [Granulicella mallensis]AEU36792.1 hypothetical protein AciX8_2476 [Granulicella mallensis MP5ACTX8]
MRTAKEAFEDISLKLKRAKKHIRDLEGAISAFHDSRPYSIRHKDNLATSERTYYVHFLRNIPEDFSPVIGDAIQNLRSALDHLATRLVDIGIEPKAKMPYYPIFKSAEAYNADKMIKILGARPEAIKAIDDTQPYPRGNGWHLWCINTMNNRDKHRLLIPVWGSLISHTFPKTEKERIEKLFGSRFGGPGWLKAASGIKFLKNGDEILTLPISEANDEMDFRISIAFGEPQDVRGKQVIPTLESMSRLVAEIVVKFYNGGLL